MRNYAVNYEIGEGGNVVKQELASVVVMGDVTLWYR